MTEIGIRVAIILIELAENYIGNKGAELLVIAATKNERIKYISLCIIFYSYQDITEAK